MNIRKQGDLGQRTGLGVTQLLLLFGGNIRKKHT